MKQKKVFLSILILFGLILILLAINSANAVSVKNANVVDIDSSKTVKIDNKNAPKFVNSPKVYSQSSKYSKKKGFETNKNTMKTIIGKKYTFITKYFLPMSWKNGGKNGKTEYWYNCQSMVVQGKYIYVYTSAGYGSNKGFIIRYDTKIIDKYNKGKGLAKLRKLGASMRKGSKLTKEQKKIKSGIKIGKNFIGGHGQSLAYNSKTNSLYMWQDNNHDSNNLKLMRISLKTLQPNLIYKFKAKLNNKYLKQFLNLAFDNNGNFYTDKTVKSKKNPTGISYIFSGKINGNKIQMKLLAIIKNRPGTYSQSLAVNRKNNRIYLVSDASIYSAPLTKMIAGTLTMNDFYYTLFSTKREFEGISFDKYGKAYLLILRGTEILKASQVY